MSIWAFSEEQKNQLVARTLKYFNSYFYFMYTSRTLNYALNANGVFSDFDFRFLYKICYLKTKPLGVKLSFICDLIRFLGTNQRFALTTVCLCMGFFFVGGQNEKIKGCLSYFTQLNWRTWHHRFDHSFPPVVICGGLTVWGCGGEARRANVANNYECGDRSRYAWCQIQQEDESLAENKSWGHS